MEKKPLPRDFSIGIVVGCILSLLGAFVQSGLVQKYEGEKRMTEYRSEICLRLNTRHYLGGNVLFSVNSPNFYDRWDEYIKNGVTPYNICRTIDTTFIYKNYPALIQDFKEIDIAFRDHHGILLKIHNSKGNNINKDIIRKIKKEGDKNHRSIGERILKIEQVLLK